MSDCEKEEAFHWFTRDDCHSLITTFHERFPCDEIEPGLGLLSTMTAQAVLLQDSAYSLIEKSLAGRHLCCVVLLDCQGHTSQGEKHKNGSHDGHPAESPRDVEVASPQDGRPAPLSRDSLQPRDQVTPGENRPTPDL